jgi:hypothetical protein
LLSFFPRYVLLSCIFGFPFFTHFFPLSEYVIF